MFLLPGRMLWFYPFSRKVIAMLLATIVPSLCCQWLVKSWKKSFTESYRSFYRPGCRIHSLDLNEKTAHLVSSPNSGRRLLTSSVMLALCSSICAKLSTVSGTAAFLPSYRDPVSAEKLLSGFSPFWLGAVKLSLLMGLSRTLLRFMLASRKELF